MISFSPSKYLWLLMAALQKGHFGKGHLQERNPTEREEQRENEAEERRKTQKTVREQLRLRIISAA